MKVLSIRQPWAELIVAGIKDVENRTWFSSYLGPILIHASKTVDVAAYSDLRQRHPLPPCVQGLTRGAIIGAARLVDVGRIINSPWHEEDCYGFYLDDAVRLEEPIPCRGRLRLFTLRDDDIPADAYRRLDRWLAGRFPLSKLELQHGK